MPIEFSLFDPSSAVEQDFAEHFDVTRSVMTVDHPEQPQPTLEEYVHLTSQPVTALGPIRRWVVREDGQIVGTASAMYPQRENRHAAVVRVAISPERRRRGMGTSLLQAILPDLAAEGRTVVGANGVKADASGELWARQLGFVRTRAHVRQILALTQVDPALWQRPVPQGFRLEHWTGAAPEALLAQYARARTAILDAPRGDTTLETEAWTPERVRAHEADLRDRDVQNHVIAAVHTASAQIAGITELELWPNQPNLAVQGDTAVATDFRGHGLGLAIKGAMLRRLTTERPAITEIYTHTTHDNTHMITINLALGFSTTAVLAELEIALADLVKRLEPPTPSAVTQPSPAQPEL
ncbi:GNAT family N-acetyltransferase [Catenulispora yoronensis]|uniref:GNAT family N-acetyltransferase n=1 Tax=Catenulispora yoronensis TaxID=450799 RepID=A0ABP5H8H1_9ACTN